MADPDQHLIGQNQAYHQKNGYQNGCRLSEMGQGSDTCF
jgi:hypothetical protein